MLVRVYVCVHIYIWHGVWQAASMAAMHAGVRMFLRVWRQESGKLRPWQRRTQASISCDDKSMEAG